MRTIVRGLMFVAMAVGVAVLVVAVARRELDRTRASDLQADDLAESTTAVSNGHGNGHQQEAYEEI